MSEKYKFRNPDGIYFVTSTIIHWIDLFTRKELAIIVINVLDDLIKNKGLVVHAWCIMPSHIHLVVSRKGKYSLPILMGMFKRRTNLQVVYYLENNIESRKEWLLRAFKLEAKSTKRVNKYKVWKDGNHPVQLESNSMIDQRLNYLHNNPVTAYIVNQAEDYNFSSARDYVDQQGWLPIEKL